MAAKRQFLGDHRLLRRLLGAFLVSVLIVAGCGMMVSASITARSLEARALAQLTNDAAIADQVFQDLQESIIFYSQLLADTEMLTEDLAPSSRVLAISLLNRLGELRMTKRVFVEPPPGNLAALVRKGLLGVPTVGLTCRADDDGGDDGRIVGVAPVESKDGINKVVTVSVALTPSFLEDIRRRIGSDITLLLPCEHSISTLADADQAALLEQMSGPDALEKVKETTVVPTMSIGGPSKTLKHPLIVNFRQEGVLLLTMSTADLLAAQRTIFIRGLLITLGILSVASIIYVSLIRRVTRPLERLSAATRDIAGGNLDLQVSVTTKDEIGELTASFNAMVTRLRESRGEIEEWGRTLEHRVEQRTQELQRAQAQVLQSEKLASLGRLVAGVAHEVINPINAIDLVCQRRLRKAADQKERDDMQVLREQARRVTKIARSLNIFARQLPPALYPTDVNSLVREILEFMELGIQRTDIRIDTDLANSLPPIQADTDQIRQVLFNIITNAWDAMSAGGTIDIRTAAVEDMVEVSIVDTGDGIAAEHLERVFEPFFTTKGVGEGTGLGLSICVGIVEAHGGTIRAESEPGRGTTFIIRLPVHQG